MLWYFKRKGNKKVILDHSLIHNDKVEYFEEQDDLQQKFMDCGIEYALSVLLDLENKPVY